MKHILPARRVEGTSNRLEKLGKFLSMPIDRATLLPLDHSGNQMEKGRGGSLILDVLMLVLMALVPRG